MLANDTLTGTSKYIADWTSAGFDMDDGTNFVAVHASTPRAGATIVAECVPSQGSPTAPFTDDDAVFQINEDTTGIKFTITKDGVSETKTITLDVTLEPAPESV